VRPAGSAKWRANTSFNMWRPKKVSESRKSLQIQKTYEALFALEDIREIFRQSLPAGFDELQQEEFLNTITKIKSIL
jgi:hypothetical protein